MIHVLNVAVILIYVLTMFAMYRDFPNFFALLLLPFSFWIQLLVSSAYIETGIYLIDFLKTSYATGATFRLFCLMEFQLLIIMLMAKGYRKKELETPCRELKTEHFTFWHRICMGAALYLLADILVSGNIFTNPTVTRFNFYQIYSRLPFAQIVSYFSTPFALMEGFFLVECPERKRKRQSVSYLALILINAYLRGIQFGGFLIPILFYCIPLCLRLIKKRRLFRVRYLVLATILLIVMLIPKYNYFSRTKMYQSLGLSSAYEILAYRALGQGADITWELDREITEQSQIDPTQFGNEILGFIQGQGESTGAKYLMKRACPPIVFDRYSSGNAGITGGYPVLWAALFGYWGALIPIAVDSILFSFLLFKLWQALQEKQLFRLMMLSYLYCQCYSMIMASGIWYLGNLIPKIIIVLLILTDIFRIKVLRENPSKDHSKYIKNSWNRSLV